MNRSRPISPFPRPGFSPDEGPLGKTFTPRNRGGSKEICPGQRNVSIVEPHIPSCVVGQTFAIVLGIDFGKPQVELVGGATVAPFFAGIRAIVIWGIGGACSFRAEVDWLEGTVLRVPADNLQTVSAEYVVKQLFPDVPEPDPRLLPPAEVSVGLAYDGGGGWNSSPARLTEAVLLRTADEVASIPIPKFAISATILSDGDQTVQASVVGLGGVRARYDALMPSGSNRYVVENAIPIPNGSDRVELRIPTLASATVVQAIFGLAL